jgi:hypothetical protein
MSEEETKKLLDKAEQEVLKEIGVCMMKYPGDKVVQSYANGQVDGLIKATEIIFKVFSRELKRN